MVVKFQILVFHTSIQDNTHTANHARRHLRNNTFCVKGCLWNNVCETTLYLRHSMLFQQAMNINSHEDGYRILMLWRNNPIASDLHLPNGTRLHQKVD